MSYLITGIKSYAFIVAVNILTIAVSIVSIFLVPDREYIFFAIQAVLLLISIPIYFILSGDGEHNWLYRAVAVIAQIHCTFVQLFTLPFFAVSARASAIYMLTLIALPCFTAALLIFDLLLLLISFLKRQMTV